MQVYDVTSYVEEHPGGDSILDHAGDDSTEGFFGYVTYNIELTDAHHTINVNVTFNYLHEQIIDARTNQMRFMNGG